MHVYTVIHLVSETVQKTDMPAFIVYWYRPVSSNFTDSIGLENSHGTLTRPLPTPMPLLLRNPYGLSPFYSRPWEFPIPAKIYISAQLTEICNKHSMEHCQQGSIL